MSSSRTPLLSSVGRAWRGLALAAVVFLLPLLLLACEEEEATTDETPSTPGLVIRTVTPSPTPEPTPTPTETPEATSTPVANVCPLNPDPAGAELMVVEEPLEGDAVTSPVYVRGWGAGIGFEDAGVQVVIYDSVGAQLAEVNAPPLPTEGRTHPDTLEPSEFNAPFGVDIEFATNFPQPGCIWVFEVSLEDGSPMHVVQIPVLLEP